MCTIVRVCVCGWEIEGGNDIERERREDGVLGNQWDQVRGHSGIRIGIEEQTSCSQPSTSPTVHKQEAISSRRLVCGVHGRLDGTRLARLVAQCAMHTSHLCPWTASHCLAITCLALPSFALPCNNLSCTA